MICKWKFVGSVSSIGGTALNRIGQEIEMTPEEAQASGVPLVEASLFDGIFTAEEVAKHGEYARRELAPADFIDKLKQSWKLIGQVPKAAEPTPAKKEK